MSRGKFVYVRLMVVVLVSITFGGARRASDREKQIDELIQTFGRRGWKNAVDAFNDESWLIRLNAREALLETGETVCDLLIAALKNTNSRIRWQAAWVLGRAKKNEAIDPLMELLADPGLN